MNAELKAKWIAALRSGEYRQTTGYLKDGGRYCCLGVLCSVAGSEPEYDRGTHKYPDDADYDLVAKLLGDVVCKDVGESTFWAMNDCQRLSFAAIADWIDANIPAESGGQ